jgi:hypothetical protein
MAFYKSDFLDQRRRQWLNAIDRVQLKVGSTWYDAELQTKEIQGTSIVLIAVCSALESVAGTITASRILDIRGEIAAEQAENITKASGQGAMIKIVLPVIEDE